MIIKKIAEFLIYSNAWIALGAASLVFFYFRFFEIETDGWFILFVFTGTMWTYTFQRFAKIKSLQAFSGKRMDWMIQHIRMVVVILATCGLALCVSLFFLDTTVILLLIPLALVSVLYVGKFPFRDLFNLRDIPFLKAHLISGVWAATSVFLPCVQSNRPLDDETLKLAGVIYLFIFALATAFDARDVEVDEPGKKTLPQLFGKNKSLYIAAVLNVAAMSVLILMKPALTLPLLPVTAITTFMVFRANKKTGDFYYSFWLDGLIVLFGLCGFFI